LRQVAEGSDIKTIALVGNPNSGKSTLFNQLTGLRQKTGNYPGITVDKKSGKLTLAGGNTIEVIDLPGIYSVYPRSKDEKIVLDILSNTNNPDFPDLVIVTIDASNLKRNLLLLTQIKDMGLEVICALNMIDVAEKKGIHIDQSILARELGVPVYAVNSKKGRGIQSLVNGIIGYKPGTMGTYSFSPAIPEEAIQSILSHFKKDKSYYVALYLNQTETIGGLTEDDRQFLRDIKISCNSHINGLQNTEILERYRHIDGVLDKVETRKGESKRIILSSNLDKILTHKIFGYAVFFSVLFIIFQAIFSWAETPMEWIDRGFAIASSWIKLTFPQGLFVDMIAEGILPGLGGIAIFIPQIALLFAFIGVLEETGYMARVVFLMDKLMKYFGLSGKSVVPLISGVACAIPAVMAARNIENWKERIITIMVTPLMTCSARLPIYIILIALVVPDTTLYGIINLQGLALFGFYMIGFVGVITVAFVFKLIIKTSAKSFLVMELPLYRIPQWRNIGFMMMNKSKTFVFQAGKIIMAISLILWVLASFGPSSDMSRAEEEVRKQFPGKSIEDKDYRNALGSYKLEHSYAAILGKTIEPVIKPLGFDWKIGIALITSFAAREIFVSTIATIYSVGEDAEDTFTIKEKMAAEVNPVTGEKVYTPAVAFSLLIFYAFAMQCMSTLAIVYRETKSIKWPLIQLGYMSVLAYVAAFITYTIVSAF